MWLIFDGLGIALGVLTWILLVFADYVIVRHVIASWFWTVQPSFALLPFTNVGVLLFVMYQCLLLLAWFSHFQAMTTDPGTIPSKTAPENYSNPKCCKLCRGQWKPPRAHHCKTCHRCIFRMDHHCPWINNCVGLANQKLFILFLGYTALSAIVTLLMLSASCVSWLWSQKSWSDAAAPSSVTIICSGLVAVECVAAVLFVSDFLQEQIESITQNSTLVETYQRTHGERGDFTEHFKQIFGDEWWWWPVPLYSCRSPDYTEPAIPDDPDNYYSANPQQDDNDALGIANDDEASSEAVPPQTQTQWGTDGSRARLRHAGREAD